MMAADNTIQPESIDDAPDPDANRMSLGEHLDELRRRMIYGLIGFFLVLVVCLIFGKEMMSIFSAPLINTLESHDLSPQLFVTDLPDSFMVFLKISLICATAVSSPWILYQLWKFIAAGLYPHERRWVHIIAPSSIGLLLAGMAMVYWLVLPWTIVFFIDFGAGIPLPGMNSPAQVTIDQPGTAIAAIKGDPATLHPGQPMVWFNLMENRLKVFTGNGSDVRVIPFGPSNLLAMQFTLPNYISLVMGMLLTFGLCFQMPLVVMAIVRLGFVKLAALKRGRKYVYFIMSIVAAVITPGDVITVTIALMIPLILLYEFGLWLAMLGPQRSSPEAEKTAD